MKIQIDLQPWHVPNFVLSNKSGDIKFSVTELDAMILSELCDKFREDIFRKAQKKDPHK